MNPLWTIPPTVVPIADSTDVVPVRRIYCVGRNYVDHIREMREGDERDDPFFFQKPRDAIERTGAVIPYPPATEDLQFEGELVVAVGKRLRAGDGTKPIDAALGFAAGIDLTRRDLQRESVSRARPWEPGKSFDRSAPCGPIVPRERVRDLADTELSVSVNGQQRQHTSLALMIWSVPEILARLSQQYTLEPGDLIYTGTPAGVSALVPGDTVAVDITDVPPLSITIADPEHVTAQEES